MQSVSQSQPWVSVSNSPLQCPWPNATCGCGRKEGRKEGRKGSGRSATGLFFAVAAAAVSGAAEL